MNGTRTGRLASRTAPWSRGAGWVTDGFREFAAGWGSWLVIALVLCLLSAMLSLVPLFGQLALHLLMPLFLAGLMLGLARRRRDGSPVRVADLFAAFESPHVGSLLLLGLLWLLMHLVAMGAGLVVTLVLAGNDALTNLAANEDMLAAAMALTFSLGLLIGLLVYLALVVPIAMMVWFAPALVVLEDEGTWSAMGHSFVGCMRNFGPYIVYGLVGLVLFPLLLVVTLGLGFLVLVPVGIASIYYAYEDIFHRH